MSLNKISINDTTTVNTGVVYDITKAIGQSYETLSDALSGNNVPLEVREGGMAVRFVQTRDNKYVQYRLMATSFSATESDWQGVDDVPTAGSANLVKSGGVKAALEENFDITNKTEVINQTWIAEDGGLVDINPSAHIYTINVNEGETYIFDSYILNSKPNVKKRLYGFYNSISISSSSFVDGAPSIMDEYRGTTRVVIPNGVVKLAISYYDDNSTPFKLYRVLSDKERIKKSEDDINYINNKIDDIDKELEYELNITSQPSTLWVNGVIAENGEYVPFTPDFKTVVLNVSVGEEYRIKSSCINTGVNLKRAYAFYNGTPGSSTFISGATAITDEYNIDEIIETPENAIYLAISDYISYGFELYQIQSSKEEFQRLEDKTDSISEEVNYINEKIICELDISSEAVVIWNTCNIAEDGGSVAFAPNYQCRKLSVSAGEKYRIKAQNGSSGTAKKRAYAFYSGEPSSSTFISGDEADVFEYNLNEVVEVPKNAIFLVVSVMTDYGYEIYKILEIKEVLSILDSNIEEVNTRIDNLEYKKIVNIWGDSVTAQIQDALYTLFTGKSYEFGRYGVGGETSQEIAARTGAIPMFLQSDCVLPADGSSVIIGHYSQAQGGTGIISGWDYNTQLKIHRSLSYNTVNPVEVNGVKCNLLWDGNPGDLLQPDDIQGVVTLTPLATMDNPVSCKNMTPIVPRSVIDYQYIYCNILFIGHNGGYVDISDLVSQNKCIIDNCKAKFTLVVMNHSISNNNLEAKSAFTKAFGENWWDWKQWAYNYGLAVNNLTPTTEDEQAIENGAMLPSLLSDTVHLNSYGQNAFNIGIQQKLEELGII